MAGSDQVVGQVGLIQLGQVIVDNGIGVNVNRLVIFRKKVRDEEAVEDGQGKEFGPQIVPLLVLNRGKKLVIQLTEVNFDIGPFISRQGLLVGLA